MNGATKQTRCLQHTLLLKLPHCPVGLPSVAVPVPVAAGQRDGPSQRAGGGAVCGHRGLRRAQSQTL